jgi:hypothetical protein
MYEAHHRQCLRCTKRTTPVSIMYEAHHLLWWLCTKHTTTRAGKKQFSRRIVPSATLGSRGSSSLRLKWVIERLTLPLRTIPAQKVADPLLVMQH